MTYISIGIAWMMIFIAFIVSIPSKIMIAIAEQASKFAVISMDKHQKRKEMQ